MSLITHLRLARDVKDPNRHAYRTHTGQLLVIDREWVDEHTPCVYTLSVQEGEALRPVGDPAGYESLHAVRAAISDAEGAGQIW